MSPSPKDPKEQARYLADTYGYDPTDMGPKRLWGFGPDGSGANLLLDATRAAQFLSEIRESVNSGFQWASKAGPLCEEPMRGVIFKLLDVTLHADAIHRGMGQVRARARCCCCCSSTHLDASCACRSCRRRGVCCSRAC